MKKMMKALLIFVSGIILFVTISPAGLAVKASELDTTVPLSSGQDMQDFELTFAEKQKAAIVEKEIDRLMSLSEEERNAEIAETFEEYEGTEFYFGEQSISSKFSVLRATATPSTNAKFINGGMNFFAYNWAGINSMANTFIHVGVANAGISYIVARLIKYAPTLGTKILSTFVSGLAGLVGLRFSQAGKKMRSFDVAGRKKGGVRITATEMLDISGKGINAYAR